MNPFDLSAIRYAHSGPRTRAENGADGDPHAGHLTLDAFVRVARRSDPSSPRPAGASGPPAAAA